MSVLPSLLDFRVCFGGLETLILSCHSTEQTVKHYQTQIGRRIYVSRSESRNHTDIQGRKDRITFKCHLCTQSFMWKTQLLNHLDDIHKVPKEYQCGICDKYFHHYTRIMNHFNHVHPNSEVNVLQNEAYRKKK